MTLQSFHTLSVWEDTFAGTTLVEAWQVPALITNGGQPDQFPSVAVGCPVCGHLWCWAELTPPEGWPARRWIFSTSPCKDHGGGCIIPHLLYQEVSHLPRAILEHDFLILSDPESIA